MEGWQTTLAFKSLCKVYCRLASIHDRIFLLKDAFAAKMVSSNAGLFSLSGEFAIHSLRQYQQLPLLLLPVLTLQTWFPLLQILLERSHLLRPLVRQLR